MCVCVCVGGGGLLLPSEADACLQADPITGACTVPSILCFLSQCDECVVCHSPLRGGVDTLARNVNCVHAVHKTCLEDWFAANPQQRNDRRCCLCRAAFVLKPHDA